MQRLMRRSTRLTETDSGGQKAALINVSHSGKFTSDRTIEEYVRDIWHLKR